MAGGRGEDWFVIRTAGKSTMILAQTLSEDGIEAWTPVLTEVVRVPRTNVRREIKLPMLPSFVFVRSQHLNELLMMARMIDRPRRGQRPAHRSFSVFHYLDKIPLIADQHLEPLRAKERDAVPKKARPSFDKNASVRVGSGAFEGLKGRVERCKSGYALVIFTDWKTPVQIPTFLLAEDKSFSDTEPKSGSSRNAA